MSARLAIARTFVVLALVVVAACSKPLKPGEALVPDGATVTHRAVFIGESNHSTVGTISLYQSDEDPVIVFEPNFTCPTRPKLLWSLPWAKTDIGLTRSWARCCGTRDGKPIRFRKSTRSPTSMKFGCGVCLATVPSGWPD